MTDTKGTPTQMEQACQATPEEMCASTLRHYEEISTKACHWSNQVPQAIRFWYLEKPKLERALATAQAKLAALLEAHNNLRADYTKVRNECDTLRADAERYRKIPSLCGVYFALGTTKEELDAAIDARKL